MSDSIIQVESLSKRFIIDHQKKERYTALRDVIANNFKAAFGDSKNFLSGKKVLSDESKEEFWALKDLNFSINQGDRVGIIGRNGAGKSTLLKVLSRITEPTHGRITIEGRVASLLEVGTGFHPELTGRENIFLNGAILGMSRTEIKNKFDEIVAFAEVEKFLDTPVKRYSSGMYVRLAFAVAAHLEPEILVVDEVLAVGDMRFQEKCLGKMEEISNTGGRTVLFVSHNIDSIRKLCGTGILLDNGQLQLYDKIENVLEKYVSTGFSEKRSNNIIPLRADLNKNEFFVESIELLTENGIAKNDICTWDTVRFRIHFYSPQFLASGSVVVQIATQTGTSLILCSTQPDNTIHMDFKKGYSYVDCVFPRLNLSAGRYLITAYLALPGISHISGKVDWALFEVQTKDVFNSGLSPHASRYILTQEHYWEGIK